MHDGYWAIRSVSSGCYLDGRANEEEVLVSDRNPEGDQFLNWSVVNLGDGSFSFQSRSNGRFLDGRDNQNA